jgi:hypothetical protein
LKERFIRTGGTIRDILISENAIYIVLRDVVQFWKLNYQKEEFEASSKIINLKEVFNN